MSDDDPGYGINRPHWPIIIWLVIAIALWVIFWKWFWF